MSCSRTQRSDTGEARTPLYIQSGFTSPWQQQIDVDAASGINSALIVFTPQSVGQNPPDKPPAHFCIGGHNPPLNFAKWT